MSNKHDEIMTYNNIIDTSVTDNEEEVYSFLGELGELPKDFISTSIMITEDLVLPDRELTDKIKYIINPLGNIKLDEVTRSLLENVVSKYITNYFATGSFTDYPVGSLTRMILSEISTLSWVDDRPNKIRDYRNMIEYWVVNILNPVLDYYLNLYSFSAEESKLMLFYKVNYKIHRHLILSFIKKR